MFTTNKVDLASFVWWCNEGLEKENQEYRRQK